MNGLWKRAVLCMSLGVSAVHAGETTMEDMNVVYQEHWQYVVPLVEKFLADPQVHNIAKVALVQQIKEVTLNTSFTLAYEAMIMRTKGEVCKSAAANEVATVIKMPDGVRAPVMFHPGTLLYVNAKHFRDLCTMYKKAPMTLLDTYNQQMGQIKAYTGGAKAPL
jgi:hypothetical protein